MEAARWDLGNYTACPRTWCWVFLPGVCVCPSVLFCMQYVFHKYVIGNLRSSWKGPWFHGPRTTGSVASQNSECIIVKTSLLKWLRIFEQLSFSTALSTCITFCMMQHCFTLTCLPQLQQKLGLWWPEFRFVNHVLYHHASGKMEVLFMVISSKILMSKRIL